MRVLVCEFVTGGGMGGRSLPASLAREGAMMRGALLRDLSELPGVEAVAIADGRLAPPQCGEIHAIRERDDVWAAWAALARGCDAAWPIAPETGGVLSRLAGTLGEAGVEVIGPSGEAISIASSKISTARRLRERGVPTPPFWRAGDAPAGHAGAVVVKPDDGAGCEATLLFDQAPASVPDGSIVQAFVPGEAASLTVLCARGATRLLAANRQHVVIEDGAFRFRGLTVGAIVDADGRLEALARAVGDALPGLDGIFGIDIVLAAEGPVVIEINPRLTTAYCGLREALGLNPVLLVPPFGAGAAPAWAGARPVEVRL